MPARTLSPKPLNPKPLPIPTPPSKKEAGESIDIFRRALDTFGGVLERAAALLSGNLEI